MIKRVIGLFAVLGVGVIVILMIGGVPRSKGGQSNIHTVNFREHGIEIVGPNEPAFATLMSEQLRKTNVLDVGALRRSSVFVVNRSGQSIAALSVNWELLLPDGRIVSHGTGHKSGLVVVSDGNSPQLMADIAPNGNRLFSLLDSSNDPLGRSGSRTGGGGGVDKARQLAESVKVTISVDGVLFADGTFSGPDTNNFFGALKAEIDARRDVIEEMAKVLNGDGEALKRVELLASGRLNGIPAPGGNDSYYDALKQTQASIMIRTRKKFGDKALSEVIEAEVSNPRINLRKLQTN
jgi:hypothetical protein